MKWDEYFIKMAMLVASKSKDPSTQVGCVIVGPDNEVRSTGYNGFPRGVVEETTTPLHKVREVGRSAFTGLYQVACSCGEVLQEIDLGFPTRPVPHSVKEIQALVEAQIGHFKEIPDVQLHPERWQRPMKYDFVEHAERNAVYNAARIGIPLNGCRAYLNWEPIPCKECTKAFIQAGIVEVIGPDIDFPSHGSGKKEETWKMSISETMMSEAGVTYRRVPWD